jgi:hypothetical protein
VAEGREVITEQSAALETEGSKPEIREVILYVRQPVSYPGHQEHPCFGGTHGIKPRGVEIFSGTSAHR